MTIEPSLFLRKALRADASVSLATGFLLCLGNPALARWFGLPWLPLLVVGVACVAYGLLAWSWAGRPRLRHGGVLGIVIGNLVWAGAAAVLLAGVGVSPTPAGQWHLALHVVLPATFGVLEWIGLRRSEPAVRRMVPA